MSRSVVIMYTEEYIVLGESKKEGVGYMSDDIRSIEGFSPMRSTSPYYGGGDLSAKAGQTIPGQGVQPIEGTPIQPQEVQELAYEPTFTTAPSQEIAAAMPQQDLPQIMKLLNDPAQHQQFCTEFQDYMNKMNPSSQLMPLGGEQAMKIPGGHGLPMLPLGGLENQGGVGNQNSSANSQNSAGTSQSLSDLVNLSGSLDDQISQLQNAISQLESQKSQLESVIQQLEQEIQQLEQQLQDMETQKHEVENQKKQKEQELNQAKQEQQKLQNQKQQLKSEESQLNGQKQSLNGQIQSLGVQIAQLTGQIATLRGTVASLHAQAAALASNPYTAAAAPAVEAQAVAMEMEIAALEAQKVQAQVQKQQAECQLQQVEAQLQQNLSSQSQIDSQLQQVSQKINSLQQEVSQLDNKLRELEQKVSELKDQVANKKKELADKKAELAQVKLKLSQAKQALEQRTAMKQQQQGQQDQQGGINQNLMDNLGGLGGLGALGGLGGGKGIGMGLGEEGGKEAMEQKAKELVSPGGPISMKPQPKPDLDHQVSQYGPGANQQQVEQMLEQVAAKYGIPQDIMKAVAWNDSQFNSSSASDEGNVKGAVHVSADLNPDYDVARGNKNPAYNVEFAGARMRDHFERTQDWQNASARLYGSDAAGQSMGAQIMALSAMKPWEGAMNNQNPQANAQRGQNTGRRG